MLSLSVAGSCINMELYHRCYQWQQLVHVLYYGHMMDLYPLLPMQAHIYYDSGTKIHLRLHLLTVNNRNIHIRVVNKISPGFIKTLKFYSNFDIFTILIIWGVEVLYIGKISWNFIYLLFRVIPKTTQRAI